MRLLIFDTETTGFLAKSSAPLSAQPELVEFAGAIIETDSPFARVETLEFRCRTHRALRPEIEQLLSLKDYELDCEKAFRWHYLAFAEFLDSADAWCAHNLRFDANILGYAVKRLGRAYVESTCWPGVDICTLRLSRALFACGPHRLRDLHYRLGCPPKVQSHRAMADVEMLLDIVRVLLEQGKFPLEGNYAA